VQVPSSKGNRLKGLSSYYVRKRCFVAKASPTTTNQERVPLKNISEICGGLCQTDCKADVKTWLCHSTSDHYTSGA